MRIVYDPQHLEHRPRTEILYGKPVPHPDVGDRVEAIRSALLGTRWEALLTSPREYPLERATTVHHPAYVAHLQQRTAELAAQPPGEEWFPYVWPRDRSMDTGTPLLAPTLGIAWRSACVALTGAEFLVAGESGVFALCRPPGHHATRGAAGGYCYLNNAALAAVHLLQATGPQAGKVAILDLDIHHGNGTQDIFYESDRVLYCSLHGEPEWAYPPHTGFPEEVGVGPGRGFTFNQPLPLGTTWGGYAQALEAALERISHFGPRFVVLSQGFDTHEGDRWGGFLLHAEDFVEIGRLVRSLGVSVLALLEGGYEPANLAGGSLALLEGLVA